MRQVRIQFPKPQQVALVDFQLPNLLEDHVLVRTEVSLMSTGTENIIFNAIYDEGTHWDGFVKYPAYPGYSCVGIVEQVGASVQNLKPGQRVAHFRPHGSAYVLPSSDCVPVPDDVSAERAAWFALAKITYAGTRQAGLTLGDQLAIVGAGPIGQMMLRWAAACGAEKTIVIDTSESRLRIAADGGASHILQMPLEQSRAALEKIFGGLPPKICDTTGNEAVFQACLPLVREQGLLLLIGDTGRPKEQRLTGDVVVRGLKIVGAHFNTVFPDRGTTGMLPLFFELVRSGRFRMDGMNTHVFLPSDADKAYMLANAHRHETMGILFDWTRVDS